MTQLATSHLPLTQADSWRAGLRVFLGLIVLYAIIWIIRVIMGVGPNLLMRWLGVGPDFRAFVGSTLNYGVGIVSYILLPAIALRKILGINPGPLLFPLQKAWWQDLLFGLILVTVVLSLFFIVELKLGWLVVESWSWQTMQLGAWLRIVWVGLLVNIGVAIGEETVFRGYLLTGLKTVWGKWIAIALMMVIFGLFHLPAYIENGFQSCTLTLAILLATLFGALFGLTYLRTGSLWLPVSLHFAWNFVENDLFNLTADSTNPNLIGALTHLQSPLTISELNLGNVIFLEGLAIAIIALGLWLWLKDRRGGDIPLST